MKIFRRRYNRKIIPFKIQNSPLPPLPTPSTNSPTQSQQLQFLQNRIIDLEKIIKKQEKQLQCYQYHVNFKRTKNNNLQDESIKSYECYSFNTINTDEPLQYQTIIHYSNILYMIPYDHDKLGIYNIYKTLFVTIKIPNIYNMRFMHSIMIDDNIYMLPTQSNIVVKFNIPSQSFMNLELPLIPKGDSIRGGVYYNGSIYFTPFQKSQILCYHVKLNEFSALDIDNSSYQYSYSVLIEEIIYYIPYCCENIGIYNIKTKEFTKKNINIHGSFLFSHAVVHNDSIYMIPEDSNAIGVYDVKKREYSDIQLTINGVQKFHMGVIYNDLLYCIPYKYDHMILVDVGTKEIRKVTGKWRDLYGGGIVVGTDMYLGSWKGDEIGLWRSSDKNFSCENIKHEVVMNK